MSITLFFQMLANGLMLGMTYVLVASGFTVVLGVAKIINFAHAEFYMLGSFGAYWFFAHYGMPYPLALVLSVLLVALMGMICERFYFRYKREHFLPAVAGAVGISLILTGGSSILFGTEERSVPSVFQGILKFGTVIISKERLAIIVISFFIMIGLYYLIMRTKVGKALRAVVLDPEVASMQGIDVNRTYIIAMVIGSGLAAAAGVLVAPVFSITPYIGVPMLFKALVVMFVGGIGSVPGAVLAGLIIGMIESFGFTLLGGFVQIIGFLILIFIALFRPGGLLGRPWEV